MRGRTKWFTHRHKPQQEASRYGRHIPAGFLVSVRWHGAGSNQLIAKPAKRDSSEKVFFSEEKKQKTFSSLSRFYPAAHNQGIKVFWFFNSF
jgi:hypothetical protein